MHVWINNIKIIDVFNCSIAIPKDLFYSKLGWRAGFFPVTVENEMFIIPEINLASHCYVLIGPLKSTKIGNPPLFTSHVTFKPAEKELHEILKTYGDFIGALFELEGVIVT